jgi:hypothetical protein
MTLDDSNSDMPPFTVHSPTRITLSPTALELAASYSMTPVEFARFLLQQDRLRREGKIQPDGVS